jgi:hypothetical protein
MLDKALQPLFRIFLRESVKRNSHADAGMRTDRLAGHIDLFVVGLDGQRYHLPDGQRRERKHVTAAERNIAHGAPIAGIADLRMHAHAGVTDKAGEPPFFLIFSCHNKLLVYPRPLPP